MNPTQTIQQLGGSVIKTLCGRKVADAATVEPDSNDLDPDCNICRRIVRAKKGI